MIGISLARLWKKSGQMFKSKGGAQHEKIIQSLNALIQATASDISKDTGLTVEQVDQRVCDLVRAGRLVIAQCNGLDYMRDGFRVLEIPMSDSRREALITECGALIEVSVHKRDTTTAGRLNKLMTGLINCRSENQIRKMELERGLV